MTIHFLSIILYAGCINTHLSERQKERERFRLQNKKRNWINKKKFFNRCSTCCHPPTPSHYLPTSPPTQPPMSLGSRLIQKSLNSFWQSLGPGSRGALSSDLHTAGRIYYTEKIRRRHSVTRLLSEREEC